ncbi:MAG: ATP-binding cassette domain-containing protein [Deltaproteobacteria bacterium]|nr:ATP-binding cassette domain-containing protein [Deltaproteobacteria bacterium]
MTCATAKTNAVLTAICLSKSFRVKKGARVHALQSVSLVVRAGSMTALVGPDGAGKTTLLRIFAGLLAPDSGSLTVFDGLSSDERQAASEQIGYMPQKFGLYEDLTVQENMDLYADLHGLTPSFKAARHAELLKATGMEKFTDRQAGKLSGGMKQKLGLICTLAHRPRLLLLDEPTVGVDPLSRRELLRIIKQFAAQGEMSVVLSTSYLDEAAQCDEIVFLTEGKVLAQAPPESIRALAEGMCRTARPASGDAPRALQARLFALPGIIDAVPCGGAVRFTVDAKAAPNLESLAPALRGADVGQTPATLEDGFMLLLHRHMPAKAEALPRAGSVPVCRDALAAMPSPAVRLEDSPTAAARDDPIIAVQEVSRLFGEFIAVNKVSFSVRRGEVFGLLGPNGAGKTTTFRMLCGLLPASKGTLRVAGIDVQKTREAARRRLGYVAQKFSLYGPLTVRENLEFFAGAYGLKGAARTERILTVSRDFSLEDRLDAPAEELPGGYRQRLAMAVGLLHKPDILFLDEPTSGADPPARRMFWQRISHLADQGVTIVVTTHFMEEAEYCDRVLIQDNGVMLALDTPAGIRTGTGLGENAGMDDAFIAIVERARLEKEPA